jgi:hypothetical protein
MQINWKGATIVLLIALMLFWGYQYNIKVEQPTSDCKTICKTNNLDFYKYYPDKQTCACRPTEVITFNVFDIDNLGK